MKALGIAALVAAAALSLAPGEARAETECGIANQAVITCGNADYPDGIKYFDTNTIGFGNGSTINVPGRSSGPTTITSGASQSTGIKLKVTTRQGATLNVGDATGGTAHIVNIVQGTNTRTSDAYNHGIHFMQNRLESWATVNVRAGVTIGSSSAPMKQRGIFLHWRSNQISQGRGAGSARFTSAATIYAARQGIHFVRENGGTNDETTLTNTGAIFSGVNNPSATGAYFDRPHGIHVLYGGTQMTGTLSVTNSGAITVGGPYTGIVLRNWGVGAMSLDNSGDIGAVAGQTARQGIQFNYEYWDNQSAAAVTLTNSGDITASDFGIRLKKLSGGDVELTNRGAITVTGDAAQHMGYAIYLTEGVTFGDGRTYAANSGDVTVLNEGALRSKNHALYVYRPTVTTGNVADDFELTNSGAITSQEGDGIRIERPDGTGDVTIDNSGAITAGANAIWIDEVLTPATTGTVSVTHSAGALSAGRSGIVVQVTSSNTAATVTPRSSSAPQPLIDVAWGGTASTGATARGTTGTAANDDGRFATTGAGNAGAGQVLTFDQEAEGGKGSGGVYGGPAGIEAYAISWRDVVAQVAKGDDPGAFANAAAQTTAVPTGATVADNAYVAQFRAALENDEIAVAPALLMAIGTTATTAASDLTDAQIVTFLRVDNAGRRTLLRNVLAQGLSDKEKAVLRAVAAGDATALTTALADADAAFSTAYKTAVNALLNRYNVGDIRVNAHSGSLTASRGDGIRAYYATQNANNGGIGVTVGAGASVTGAKAGIYVANAGTGLEVAKKYTYGFAMGDSSTADAATAVTYNSVALLDQVVTVAGTVTGGTDAGVRLSGGAVIVMAGGSVRAGSLGVGVLADGAALVYVDGEVRGGAGGAAAVHLKGGGTVTVGLNGRVRANGATNAIQRDGTAGTTRLTLITDTVVPYRNDVNDQVDGILSGIDSARLVEHRNGVPTGYSLTLTINSDGRLDTGKLPPRPIVYDCAANGRCIRTGAGTIENRRTGLYAAVPSESATANQRLIDVNWTATFSQGTAVDAGRFAAATVGEALVFDRESEAVKAAAATIRWGAPAGIEAHALSWRDAAAEVAKGDDPGAIANAAAQTTLLATSGAGSRRAAILAQFRAALGNADLTVAAPVLVAIGTTATTAPTALTDAQIVTYLQTDDAPTRALLRNILAQGLSDAEKAVLRAVAAGDGDALTTALNAAGAGFSNAYKTAVRALLGRSNAGDIRVRMASGSIVTQGDGIRAYFATPHADNGGINVAIAAGARVTADLAGVYAANAGGAVMVANDGIITADAHGIRVADAGGAVTVTNRGTVTADAHGVYVADAGGAVTVTVAGSGTVTADGSDAHGVYVANAGGAVTVTVADSGTVRADGSDAHGVYVADAGGAVTVTNDGTVRADGSDAHGIYVADAGGAVTVANSGTVRAGSSDAHGIYVADADGAVTVTNSGSVTAAVYGIHVVTGASGDVAITTTGGSIAVTATAGRGIYPQDNAGHTGAVAVTNGGDVTAEGYGIYANRLGSGAVTVTNTGGTVRSMTQPGIFAANKEDDASAVTVDVDGGAVRSEGRNKPAVDARNRGTGDLDLTIAAGATAVSRGAAGVYATLDDADDNRLEITQGGTIRGRTGVHALVAHGSTAETATPRAAEAQPLISVTWTGAFSHGTTADVAPDDVGRFQAANAGDALDFDRETAAMEAVAETIRWGAPAGVEAQVMSWREAARVVATGDDPGTIADDAARLLLFDVASTDAELKARSDALVRQARAVLENDEIMVEAGSALDTAIAAIETDGTEGLSDAEIAAWLSANDAATRTLLRDVLAQGLSEAEKSILRAVAAGDDDALEDALEAAGFTDDEADDDDYWSRVKALLERYNVGDIRVAVTGGSIDSSRGDGIRAYYATPHANNGGIRVTVSAGARVTGAAAGVHVANAGPGLTLARKYTLDSVEGDNPDELVAVTRGEAPLRNQIVTVAGTVTGGTDAAVRLSGGGAVLVMAGGKVHAAGSSGVGILADGPAHLFIDGEVKGGAGGAAAVDLPGGGAVIVGRNGRVQADGADHAIRGGDGFETAVTVTVATGPTAYRENVNAQLAGLLKGVEGGVVRLREYRNGFTGYSTGELAIAAGGTFDTSGLPRRPCSEDEIRGADGMCAARPTDSGRVAFTEDGGMESHGVDGIGVRAWYAEPGDDNGGISVTVPAGVNVTGSVAGVYVENAGRGLRIRKRYAPEAIRDLAVNADKGEDDLIAIGSLNAAGNAIETPWLDQLVTVESGGTVNGGTDAAIHLNGGGAVIVMARGRVLAGSSGVAIKVNDPGPAHLFIDGEVTGRAGGAAAVDLPAGGSVIVGRNGRVQANGAARAIRGGDTAATEVSVTLATGATAPSPDDVNARVEGSLEDVEGDVVHLREYRDGAPVSTGTGYSRTLPIKPDGTLDTDELRKPEEDDDGNRMKLNCAEAGDGRCRLYEALPSVLLAMNRLPTWAERTSAVRDAHGGWARVEAAHGEWRAKKSTSPGRLAYDHRRSVGRAGVDLLVGENGRLGASAHGLRGKAEMAGVGEIELNGVGAGVSAAWLAGGFYAQAQAQMTLYDVDLKSYTFGGLVKKDASGAGYALGAEVGGRLPLGGAFVTPRAGVAWSGVELSKFTDMERAGGPRARVSMKDAGGVTGRLGVTLEAETGSRGAPGRLFGSLDVEQAFADETKVRIGGEALRAKARPTALRLEAGGAFALDENVLARIAASWRTSGGGTREYGGSLGLQVLF